MSHVLESNKEPLPIVLGERARDVLRGKVGGFELVGLKKKIKNIKVLVLRRE